MINELEVVDLDFPGRKLSLARVRRDENEPPVWSLAIVGHPDVLPITVTLSMDAALLVGEALAQERMALAGDVVDALRAFLAEWDRAFDEEVEELFNALGTSQMPDSFPKLRGALAAWDSAQPAPTAIVSALAAMEAEAAPGLLETLKASLDAKGVCGFCGGAGRCRVGDIGCSRVCRACNGTGRPRA